MHEIEAVRTLLAHKIPVLSHTFVKIGQRVRIRGGSLDGVEGILVGRKGDSKLLLSVNLIQQSVALSLEGYTIEPA